MQVLVCDDHPIVASAVAMMIEDAFSASVHIAHDYRHTAAIAAEHPDIALCLLDIHIPGDDARAGITALRAALPTARHMLFSGSADEADLILALELDMHGFLPKSSTPQVVEAAVQLVLAGGVYLPSGIGELAMRHAQAAGPPASTVMPAEAEASQGVTLAPAPSVPPAAALLYGTLTDRQMIVLQQVAAGRSNKEIARDLAISPATVKAHVAHIIALLGTSNRIEAAARARTLGLIASV